LEENMWFLIFFFVVSVLSFVVGLLAGVLLLVCRVPHSIPPLPLRCEAADPRQLAGALQHLQVLMGLLTKLPDPTLCDVVQLLEWLDDESGTSASLERVIQRFVAEDLARQCAARRTAAKGRHTEPLPTLPLTRETSSMVAQSPRVSLS
jgi:hypothetical protein